MLNQKKKKREPGHYNENKFRQMYDEMATLICLERLLGSRTSVLSTKSRLQNESGIG